MKVLVLIIEDGTSKRLLSSAVEAMGRDGELMLLKILPTAAIKDLEQVEGKEIRRKRARKAIEDLEANRKLTEELWHSKHREIEGWFQHLFIEGPPAETIIAFSDNYKPDLIFIAEWDTTRWGSFASGDLVAAVRKGTGVPVRVVG